MGKVVIDRDVVKGSDGGSVVGIPVDSVVGGTAFRVTFTETLYIKKHQNYWSSCS